MRINEAKDIFAEVLTIDCPVCSVAENFLCDTYDVWVHDERITYANIEDDQYLRLATIKRMKVPTSKPDLGDRYVAFSHSANTFYELFSAFNRDVTRAPNQESSEPRSTLRSLYLAMVASLMDLSNDFTKFSSMYENQDLSPEDRKKFSELTDQVFALRRNQELFANALRNRIESSSDVTFDEALKENFRQFELDFLRFSLQYSVATDHLLGSNLEGVFEVFSEAYDDKHEIND